MRRLIVVASLVAAACGVFPDLSGLNPPVDAALVDAQLSDVASDAGADAGFCLTHPNHTFCEDFDEPNFAARWTSVVTSPTSATVMESDASSVSAPNELLASILTDGGATAMVYASKHFAQATTVKIQLQLRVNPATALNFDPVMIVLNPPPAAYKNYQLHIDTADQHFGCGYAPADGGAASTFDMTFPSSLTAWSAVEIDLDMATSMINILVDGISVTQTSLPAITPSAFDLRVGAVQINTATTNLSAVVHVDNVLVDNK
jgi:hypothetical protein